MLIANNQYLAAADELAGILDQYRESYQDFLSQIILQKGDEMMNKVMFQAVWRDDPEFEEEHAQIADASMRELFQKILVDPLTGVPFDEDPVLDGDWTLPAETFKGLREHFEKSPLDGSNLATCEPVRHLFVSEMLRWKRKWIVQQPVTAAQAASMPAPSSALVVAQSQTALAKFPHLYLAQQRFIYTRQCNLAVLKRKQYQLDFVTKHAVTQFHEQTERLQAHSVQVIHQATQLARISEQNLCTKLAGTAQAQQEKVAQLTGRIEEQADRHQEEVSALSVHIASIDQAHSAVVADCHGEMMSTQEHFTEAVTAASQQMDTLNDRHANEIGELTAQCHQAAEERERDARLLRKARTEAYSLERDLRATQLELNQGAHAVTIQNLKNGYQVAEMQNLARRIR